MTIPQATHVVFSDAIESGNVDAVVSLIQQHPDLVNHPDWTPPPLHCAVLWNQPKVAEALLEHGADIEVRDRDRNTTPIKYAVFYCKKDLISLFLARGANTDFKDEGEKTLLQSAVEAADGAFEKYDDLPRPREYREIVDMLRRLGVD